MSTPPTPPTLPKDTLELLPPPRGRSILAKLTIAFAVTIPITFGLCSLGVMASPDKISGYIFPAAILIQGTCVVGLVVVAILFIVRNIRSS